MTKLVSIATVAAAVLLVGAGQVAATSPRTLVVDRDGVECANAGLVSGAKRCLPAALAGGLR
jgi:hypothetical protein